jgi:RNA polymerase sigma-70 factor (ECF subfamily)
MSTEDLKALDRFRSYLLLLARAHLPRRFQGKLDPSDVVQQTLLQAHRHAAGFRGQTAGEQAAWLRQILAATLANIARDLQRDKRDIDRERSFATALDESASRLEAGLAAVGPSPSEEAERHEHSLRLADAIACLPEQQREAVVLRHFHDLSLVEIAEQLDCTTAAVTGLLYRGLKGLRQRLQDENKP